MLFLIFVAFMPAENQYDLQWMARCFDLARRGIGQVSPNPPVGAVLVWRDEIIGEGFHRFFGGPHAEVEAFRNVPNEKKHLIPESVLYVSLEPCCIHGKTPPCTDLIMAQGVKDVRISTTDPNPNISGKSIDIMKSHAIDVTTGILEEEGNQLIRIFRTNMLKSRPYIILKWAQSSKGYIGKNDGRVIISHPYTNAWSHSLRSEADVIMVGARTVLIDNPALTTRDAPGRSPHRAVYDPGSRLTKEYKVFKDDGAQVFYFSTLYNPDLEGNHILQFRIDHETPHVDQVLAYLFSKQKGILLVEGGGHLLSLFIRENKWDEGWIIRTKHPLDNGSLAPAIKGKLIHQFESATDTIVGMVNEENEG